MPDTRSMAVGTGRFANPNLGVGVPRVRLGGWGSPMQVLVVHALLPRRMASVKHRSIAFVPPAQRWYATPSRECEPRPAWHQGESAGRT